MIPSTPMSLINALNRSGSDMSWSRFVSIYRDVIHHWCLSRGLNDATAEDLTQDVLIRLLAALPKYSKEKGKFRVWLKTVVNNVLNDSFRTRKIQCINIEGEDLDWLADDAKRELAAEEIEDSIASKTEQVTAIVLERVQRRVRKPQIWRAFQETKIYGMPVTLFAKESGMKVGAIYKSNAHIIKMIEEEHKKLSQEDIGL